MVEDVLVCLKKGRFSMLLGLEGTKETKERIIWRNL